MIHHASVEVSDLERSGRFYDAVVGALGWRRHVEEEARIGWGLVRPLFYASARRTPVTSSGHICLASPGISGVKGAWEAGLGAGGSDDGAPGQRPEYGATYYSAYLLDPDGNRIEIAVGAH
ncbi:MAG: VOC family protein [Actinomycetota bacterium]|nr:VOC family protein [Actinomycetota bacterium]